MPLSKRGQDLYVTIRLKLLPTVDDAARLRSAVRMCNAIATSVSRIAWRSTTYRKFELQRLVYARTREDFPSASSQSVVRAVARVAAAYANRRSTKKRAHIFRPNGAVPFDARMLSFNRAARVVSIWTPGGRIAVAYTSRESDIAAVAQHQVRQCDLVERNGCWLLCVALRMEAPRVHAPANGFIGIDQGMKFLAVTSDGVVLPGEELRGTVHNNRHVEALRNRRRRQRNRLANKRTRSARRLSRRLCGRESRMVSDVNHQISKYIVRTAERTDRGVAMEELGGIRDRVRAYGSQRRALHTWAFDQLTRYCEYKALRLGIALLTVNPAYTSQMCPNEQCGHTSPLNRPTRGRFECTNCGLAGPSDHIAGINIARRAADAWAAANLPNASCGHSSRSAPEASHGNDLRPLARND